MEKKKVLKITPVLITLNVLVLFTIVGFYMFRLVKYYKIENGDNDEEDTVYLVDTLKRKQSYLDETKGLVLNEDTGVYTYKGKIDDNYLKYSGMIYRILSIDKNNNIKAVSESNVTILYPELKKGYEKSSINKWLNVSEAKYSGIYEKTLVDSDDLLVKTSFCNDVIDDVSSITCDNVLDTYNISLLSLYDYKMAGGKESFLNNGDIFYLGSLNSKNDEYYVTDEGEIALNERDSKAITIKPVITISGGSKLLSGDGSKNKPYIIEKHKINTIADAYVNSIVKIDDINYKVIEVQKNKVKLTSLDVIMKKEKPYLIKFGGETSAYTTTNTVGKYLNKTFLKSLSLKDYVVNGNYFIGSLALTNLDYAYARSETVKAKVGMLTIGDMFINETTNTFTLLRGMEDVDIINVINENGGIFADTIEAKYNVRPAFYIKSSLEILSGKGTLNSPYELGVKNEEAENSEKTETEG